MIGPHLHVQACLPRSGVPHDSALERQLRWTLRHAWLRQAFGTSTNFIDYSNTFDVCSSSLTDMKEQGRPLNANTHLCPPADEKELLSLSKRFKTRIMLVVWTW